MKRWMRYTALLLLAAVMLMCFASCDRTHVDKEIKEICQQALDTTDAYLKGESDIMVTYTTLCVLLTYWDGLNIETTKYTFTKNFEAKMMLKNIIESTANQASGEDARDDILRQRNALAELAGLKQLKVE